MVRYKEKYLEAQKSLKELQKRMQLVPGCFLGNGMPMCLNKGIWNLEENETHFIIQEND